MNRITAAAGVTAILVAAFGSALSGMQDPKEPLGKELRAVIDANLAAGNKRDLEAYMATVHPKGPDFRDNDIDSVQVFRKDKDAWKIWSSAMLEVKFHE